MLLACDQNYRDHYESLGIFSVNDKHILLSLCSALIEINPTRPILSVCLFRSVLSILSLFLRNNRLKL